jgi:uncharacterized OsmC-like protein
MSDAKTFSLSLEQLENYVFKIDFGDFGYILTDEPEPLGQGEGPNPARLVGAAVANCLCASLLFALRKKKQPLDKISARVSGELDRVDGFWRIVSISVAIEADTQAIDTQILEQAVAQFESFCIVTESIRRGIPVKVDLTNADGNLLFSSH